MHTIFQPPAAQAAGPAVAPRYRILPFASRSDAVRYCLKVSDALESASLAGDSEGSATLWLAAADGATGAVNVYACDGALAVAREAGLETTACGQASEAELPAARCLVIGDKRLLGA